MNLLNRPVNRIVWIALVLFFVLGSSRTTHAGDSYHVCSQNPHHDLTFRTESDGSVLYAFTGDLTCHVHFNTKLGYSLAHDTSDEFGGYRVKTWVKGNRVHEKIWFQVNENSSSTPSIESRYSCQANPFTHPLTQNRCTRLSRSYPHPSQWRGAVEEAAHFLDPLSVGLASDSMLQAVTAPAASGNTNGGNQQPKDLFDSHNQSVALIQDAALSRHKFSSDRREYHFTFTAHQGCYELPDDVATNERHPCREVEKLEALATKYIDGQRVDVSIRGGGHHIDLQYKCANIMDPFLDPSNNCSLTNIPASFNDSLYRDLVQRKYNLVYHFSHAIRGGVRTPMVWEALAGSMRPAIFEGGKKAAPEGTKITFSSDADIVLDVESARDIKRNGEQTVFFHIKPDYGSRVSDINGNIIAMPLTSKYTGNTYNGAVQTVKHLAPGKYTFFTAMMTSLTKMEKSKKIPFEVISHISPKQAPVISSPGENEKIEKDAAVSFKILVSQPMFGTGFDAKIQCEHSRLAAQTPYRPIDDFLIKNDGQESMLENWHSFGDGKQFITGDFRCRAKMVYDGKERGEWSGWRHFHIGGKAIPHMHAGFAILSPKKDKTYEGKIPVKISLPKNITKDARLLLSWEAVSGQWAGNTLDVNLNIAVQPGEIYKTVQDAAQFTPWMQGSDGRVKLVAMLDKDHKAEVIFTIPTLGIPAQKEDKKSGTFSLDTPIFTTPDEGQTFMTPATVKMKILHGKEEEIFTRLQYCPFSKDKMAILHYQDNSLKPVATSTKEGTTTVTYRIDKPGFWRAQATTTGKPAFSSAWRAFKVDILNNTAAKSVKLGMPKGITSSRAPHILAPANHAVFQKGKEVVLKIDTHGTTKPMTDEVQFKDRKNTFTLLYTGTAGQSTTGGMVETRLMINDHKLNSLANIEEGATEYRVRVAFAHKDEKGFLHPEEYSPWLYVKMLPKLKTPVQIPQKSFIPVKTVSAAQVNKSGSAGKMAQKSINPQPEPPGKQLRTISKNLVIMPHPRNFRPGAPIQIAIKNTPFSRVPFELRYRPAPGTPYQAIKHPKHSFKRTNGMTSLRLVLKQPGQYQLRFRANHKAPWTGWSSLTVMDNPAKAAALAHQIHMAPATGSRMINPQPEPPGKVRRHQVRIHGTAGKGKEHPITRASSSPAATARKIHIAPPKIEQPRNGQKFLLTGKSVQVQAQISYAGKQKIQVELQRKTGHRFSAIHPRMSFTKSRAITTATISLQLTGSYRLRVRAGSNARWSGWTTFNVDTLMNNMPSLQQHTPAPEQKTPTKKPALSIKPSLPMVR
ncbi:MAG TPA: hypothetical protein ENJ30_01155 [Desulfobulbaceae bacterium]|nr:hypothetical protein [Desulfobulbaceae bacterium]